MGPARKTNIAFLFLQQNSSGCAADGLPVRRNLDPGHFRLHQVPGLRHPQLLSHFPGWGKLSKN
jgi:hypothetical protein